MSLSRKEFFKQGVFSLGERLLKAGETIRNMPQSTVRLAEEIEPAAAHLHNANGVARVNAVFCLAINCGCFSCVERCDTQAISVVMGEGIRIDEACCTGCGTCEYVCPVTPKAVTIVSESR
jgi:ferredoxin